MRLSIVAVALACVLAQQQPPTFRTGTNVVRVDVTVIDRHGRPVNDLTAADFDVRENGQPQAITAFKLVAATGEPSDELSLPIRSPEHAAAEAARDDVRVFLIFWDEYHIGEFRSTALARPALERILLESFGPTDLVGLMDPLTPTDAIRFSRDRRALADQAHKLKGRRGVYFPRSVVEEEHFRWAQQAGGMEVIRQQVTTSALKSAMVFLSTLREGRKALVLISETLGPTRSYSETTELMSTLVRTANDSNTAIYVIDPRGLEVGRSHFGGMLDTIAAGSGGEFLLTNDPVKRFKEVVVARASAFYLLGYPRDVPEDGKFHEIKVRVKRPGVEVRARSGYWAPRAGDVAASRAAAAAAVLPPSVEAAFAALRPARSRSPVEVWAAAVVAAGGPRVTIAWTPYAIDDVRAARVAVMASAGETRVFAGDVEAGGTSFAAPPGSIDVMLTVYDEQGEVIDRQPRTIVVPDPDAGLVLPPPVIARARGPLERRAQAEAVALPVHAGREFERTDRLLVRVLPHPGDGVAVEAWLLDRRGARLVTLTAAPDPARGGHTIDLPLGGVARGEYVLAIDARREDARAEAHVAFRVVK